jgi:hypothetical protein
MYEREKSRSAKKSAKGVQKKSTKNQGVRERKSANAKARNLRPKIAPKRKCIELPPGARKRKREA